MGWLRLVGSFKLYVSVAEYHLFCRALLQKRPIILRSLIIEATPLSHTHSLTISLSHPHPYTHTHRLSLSLSHTHTHTCTHRLLKISSFSRDMVPLCITQHIHTHTHSLSLSHTHTHTLSLSIFHTYSLSFSRTHTHTHTHRLFENFHRRRGASCRHTACGFV